MFFLGISAHILVYLLVPAFLIVCFYFNGRPDIPEVANLSPVYITHEPQARNTFGADTYVYNATIQITPKAVNEKKRIYVTIPSPSFHWVDIAYLSPEKENHTLRAPPVLILA